MRTIKNFPVGRIVKVTGKYSEYRGAVGIVLRNSTIYGPQCYVLLPEVGVSATFSISDLVPGKMIGSLKWEEEEQ